jgi:hypothetical protein
MKIDNIDIEAAVKKARDLLEEEQGTVHGHKGNI